MARSVSSSMLEMRTGEKMDSRRAIRQFSIARTATLLMKTEMAFCGGVSMHYL